MVDFEEYEDSVYETTDEPTKLTEGRGRAYRRKAKYASRRKLSKAIDHSWYLGYECDDGHIKMADDRRVKKFLKKQSVKAVRKSHIVGKGNQYKKVFDYWWNLY